MTNKPIFLKICNDSGLLATPKCPISKIKWKEFEEGKEPKKQCRKHKRGRRKKYV